MEIMKIFSDAYDEERLYSVLLSEDEMDLYQYMFSEEEEEEKPRMSRGKKAAIAGAGVATAGAGVGIGHHQLMKNTSANLEKSLDAAWNAPQERWRELADQGASTKSINNDKKYKELINKAKKTEKSIEKKIGSKLNRVADYVSGVESRGLSKINGIIKRGKKIVRK